MAKLKLPELNGGWFCGIVLKEGCSAVLEFCNFFKCFLFR